MRDHNSLTEAMYELYSSFLHDANAISGYSFEREDLRVIRILKSSGRVGFLSFLQKHHLVLLGWLQTDEFDDPKVACDNEGYPLFLNSLWRDLTTCKGELGSVTAFTLLRQATCLLRKWAEDTVKPDDSIDAFVERMGSQNTHLDEIIDRISDHLDVVLGDQDLSPDASWPLVSTGARASRVPVLQRIDEIGYVPNPEIFRKDGFRISSNREIRFNRLVAVPKDWSKVRLVFAEPSPSMNLQQLLRLWIENRVGASAEKRVDFESQDFQQSSLRQSGRSSIDLSDASDFLSASVVWRFLRKRPVLRSALFWGRSTHTLVHSNKCALSCFGTMGNATTFTVMSLFLACLTREAEFHYWGYTGKRVKRSTVFGDDIVCDDEVAGTVLELLRGSGLVPSGTKTFIAKRFKESCGLDLFEDQDVTPTYIKHVRITCLQDLDRAIHQSNALYKAHYWHLASYLETLARQFLRGRNLSVNVDSSSLWSYAHANVRTSSCKWNAPFQRWDSAYASRVKVRSRERDSHLDLQYALFHGNRIQDTV